MLGLNDVTSSFTDRLTTGKSAQGSLFRQVAGDLAKQALGVNAAETVENQVRIYFTDPQTNESLQIPVMPPDITIKWDRKTETVEVLNLGEVDFTTGKKLQEISFSSFFPLDGWCAARNTDYVPDRPVRLMIVGTSLNINMLVLITSLEMKDRGGNPGDLYYSLSCREWREIKVRTEAEQRNRNNRPNPKAKPKTITQKAKANEPVREMLYKIAKAQYGNGSKWTKILSMNQTALQGDATKKALNLVLR